MMVCVQTTHSLDELTFERVYMLLEASFVVPLSAKRDQIKIQLEILLYKVRGRPPMNRVCLLSPQSYTDSSRAAPD